jgi:hypothetical protein
MLRVVLPVSPQNGTSVVFKHRLHGEPLVSVDGSGVPIVGTDWGNATGVLGSVGPLMPGLTYDFYAYIHNSKNAYSGDASENAQNGEPIEIVSQIVPTPTTFVPTPLSMAGWTIHVSALVGGISVLALPPPSGRHPAVSRLRFYRLLTNTGALPSGVDLIGESSGGQFTDATGSPDSRMYYYYWYQGLDHAGASIGTNEFIGPSEGITVLPAAQVTYLYSDDNIVDVATNLTHSVWLDMGSLRVVMPDLIAPATLGRSRLVISGRLKVVLSGTLASTDVLLFRFVRVTDGAIVVSTQTLIEGQTAATTMWVPIPQVVTQYQSGTHDYRFELFISSGAGLVVDAGDTSILITEHRIPLGV